MDDLLNSAVATSLKEYHISHKLVECDPEFADTAAFCETYGYSPDQSANTIIVASRKVDPVKYACCVVLAHSRLDVNKKVCELLGVKRASFASGEQAVELTGMMIGGVVAIGVKNMPIYTDSKVMEQKEIIMGGGTRSVKLLLSPNELKKIPNAQFIENLAKL